MGAWLVGKARFCGLFFQVDQGFTEIFKTKVKVAGLGWIR